MYNICVKKGSMVVGNVLTVVVFRYFDSFTYFIILFGLAIVSGACFICISDVKKHYKVNEFDKQTTLMGIFDKFRH